MRSKEWRTRVSISSTHRVQVTLELRNRAIPRLRCAQTFVLLRTDLLLRDGGGSEQLLRVRTRRKRLSTLSHFRLLFKIL